jgi:hypothetical protein
MTWILPSSIPVKIGIIRTHPLFSFPQRPIRLRKERLFSFRLSVRRMWQLIDNCNDIPAGTQISVFGSIAPRSSGSSPVSSYSIDGSPETTYVAEQVRTVKFLQLFYRSPVLHLAHHILSITCQANGPLFLLDYVVLFPLNVSDSSVPPYVSSVSSSSMGPSFSTSSVQSFISTPSVISLSTTTTKSGDASSIASDSPNSSSTLHNSHQAAKIAGGILAGLLFLALISIVGLFFLRRRRERRKAPSAMFLDHSMRQLTRR